jgi:ribulose-5-phosphate 4-epimerase/fuculose-1-phosphate aldolase
MRGHGITTVGLTLDEMFDVSLNMEDNARVLWEALAIGQAQVIEPDVIARRAQERSAGGGTARALRFYANLEAPEAEQRHMELRR